MKSGKGKESYKVAFWNVARISNKREGFWKEVRKWDVIIMSETWLNEKG